MYLDHVISQIYDPDLGDPGISIKRKFYIAVILQAHIGDLHNQDRFFRPRVPVAVVFRQISKNNIRFSFVKIG